MTSKRDGRFDRDDYAPVADRIALFYERFPMGRIETHLIDRSERGVVFRAAVYRGPDEPRPAATGWAAEREGDGEINTVACLENTETSAVGRALANLGFTASRQRASAEEMAKVARERARRALSPAARDLVRLIRAAERVGWPEEEATRLRARAADGLCSADERTDLEQRLRAFVSARMATTVAALTDHAAAPFVSAPGVSIGNVDGAAARLVP
jgi:hypothetical protein